MVSVCAEEGRTGGGRGGGATPERSRPKLGEERLRDSEALGALGGFQ